MSIRIVHGANEGRFEFAGLTVSQIQKSLKDAFNIPNDALALVDGESVDRDFIMTDQSNLEFVRTVGHKGGLHEFWSEQEVTVLLGPEAVQSMKAMDIHPVNEQVFTSKQICEYLSNLRNSETQSKRRSPLVVDFSTMTLSFGNQGTFEINGSLTFKLLNRLNARPFQFIHIDILKNDVWNDDLVEDETVNRTARRLRKVLAEMNVSGVELKTQDRRWALVLSEE
ncbi:transcriptional regulator [Roseiconus lacunae]|uniref:transcriptional regulator n=1 Tax=Roseiconus lacunae TaxID=2605694 RepID=UPI001E3B6A9A|nr:transcriptional regulator [Roseiconus lacunae]MCD0459570.1 transcriptional regulator [Roseiconus lacunae]